MHVLTKYLVVELLDENILSKTTYKIFFHFKVLNKNTFTLNKEEEAEFKENIGYIEDICDRYSYMHY